MASQSMDWSSSSAGVRKPVFKRQARIVMRRGRKPALTLRQRAEVQRLVHRNLELKYFAFNSGAGSAIGSTFNISPAPFLVTQGVTDSNRIGDELTWVSAKLRFEIVNSLGVASDNYNNFRFVIFQWHPNSTPVATDVFISGPSGAPDIYSTYGHDRRHEFTIVYDECFKTVGNGQAATSPFTSMTTTGVQNRDISFRFAKKKCSFVGAGVTATNLFYVALVSDSTTIPHPTISYQIKTFYRDG